MGNETKVEVEDEIADLPTVEEGEEDLTDYKALAAKNAGIAQRYKTKFEKSKIAAKVEKGVEKKIEKEKESKESFDYAELAFIEQRGVTEEEDQNWLFAEVQTTGKALREILGFDYVKEHLKNSKEALETKGAVPKGSKRSSPATRDSVEYHIANQTPLLKIEDVALRRKVLNARIKTEDNKNKFTDNPLV